MLEDEKNLEHKTVLRTEKAFLKVIWNFCSLRVVAYRKAKIILSFEVWETGSLINLIWQPGREGRLIIQ